MMKLLTLDLRYTGKEPGYEAFKSLAESNFECELVEFNPVDPMGCDPDSLQDWFEDVFRKIDEAHAFVCFGSYFLFGYVGPKAEDICQRLIARIGQGTPILVQSASVHDGISPEPNIHLVAFFRYLDVMPLAKKVVSHLNRGASQVHDHVCWFDKSAGTLRDPALFSGVDRVVAYAPKLLAYDGEMLPVIDSRPPEYLYVDSLDLMWSGDLGMHPSIASVGRMHGSIQIVIAANLFSDSRKSAMGLNFALIEDNKLLASNIIQLLLNSAKTPQSYETSAYQVFVRLERLLGKLLITRIGPENILKDLPDGVLKNLCRHQTKPDFSLATFNDLIRLVFHHWTALSKHFPGVSKTKLKMALYSVNEGSRRYLAHPHKAAMKGVSFSDVDIIKLKKAVDLVNIGLSSKA